MHLQKKLKRDKDPILRQRIQMILLRGDEHTQPNRGVMGGMLLNVAELTLAYEEEIVIPIRMLRARYQDCLPVVHSKILKPLRRCGAALLPQHT
jgi:hypothetical protein